MTFAYLCIDWHSELKQLAVPVGLELEDPPSVHAFGPQVLGVRHQAEAKAVRANGHTWNNNKLNWSFRIFLIKTWAYPGIFFFS